MIETERLVLRLARRDDVPGIVRYFEENRAHLAPWDPDRPDSFYTEGYWRDRVQRDAEEFTQDVSLKLWGYLRQTSRDDGDTAGVPICNINFTNFVRGPGQFCRLGYSVAAHAEGRGYMTEGVAAAVQFVFDRLHMHQVQAGYMPHNRRSGKLLKRLGFTVVGYARDHRLINGRWEDHVDTALINRNWRPR